MISNLKICDSYRFYLLQRFCKKTSYLNVKELFYLSTRRKKNFKERKLFPPKAKAFGFPQLNLMKNNLRLLVTLSPSMPHFERFATDNRIDGIRINSAMMYADELNEELETANRLRPHAVPMWFDIKGRQLRVKEVAASPSHLELILNHRIQVATPTTILFKGGEDYAVLARVVEDGKRLIFQPGAPKFNVIPGESICIRDPDFKILDDAFPAYEVERIKKVVASGFDRYVLSYVESQRDIDEFRSYIGREAELLLKIENERGLRFVTEEYKPQPNTSLMAARGDLYIEISKPHLILNAMRLIIEKDPNACVGSRILLSCVNRAIPDAVDFSELAWLYDVGYRNMMLCDDLCIREDRLSRAVNVFNAFRQSYVPLVSKVKATTVIPSVRNPTIRERIKAWMHGG